MGIKALLWDVDGTLAETELDGHLIAFNQAFGALSVPWRWSEQRYGELLAVAGGRERLLHDMQSQEFAPASAESRLDLAERVHLLKNERYATIVRNGELPLRDGVRELLEECRRANVRMAIVTTTSRSNVEALLQTHLGGAWEKSFAAVVCAEVAPRKKPDPQAYLRALDCLQLAAGDCVAIEDSPAGYTAARAAGVPVLVTRSHYFPERVFPASSARDALAVGPSLASGEGWHPAADPGAGRIGLAQICRWHADACEPA